MAKLPWYKWYHIEWRISDSRADMNLAERGLYRDLLDIHYADGSIPADPGVLAKMVSVDPVEFAEAWKKVSHRFCKHRTNPMRLVNKRAVKVCKEVATYRQAQSEIARIAAKERAKRKKQIELEPQATLRLASANPQPSESDIESESDTESEKNKISVPNGTSPPKAAPSWGNEFDSWWAGYPRKASKGAALKAFDAVIVKGQVPAAQKSLILNLKGYTARLEALKEGTAKRRPVFESRQPEHRPHPASFIRSLDWLTPEEAPEKRERMAWE